ncbi:MAG: transporter [Burkholderiales bacterium]
MAAAADGDDDAITPYRPSVSSPAQLPVPGQLEIELGGLHALAFSKEWGVVLGGEAHVWARDDAGRAQVFGDTALVLKHAWIVDGATAFGVEFGTKLPTANDSIGSGRADYTLNTIFSRDIGPVHLDANLNATRLGVFDDGTGRTQFGASASFSGALSDHWGLTGEVSGTHRSGAANGSQLLAAVTYSPSRRLTFDFGVARALRPTPATTQVFAGVAFPLGKLW